MDIFGLDTLKSTDPDFNWDNVHSGDVVDGTNVLGEVGVQSSRPSTSDGYYWLEGHGYYQVGEKALGHRDGVPGLEDLFGHRTFPAEGGGSHWIDAEGNFVNAGVVEASVEYGPGAPIKVISTVKKFSDLLRVADRLVQIHGCVPN